MKKKEDFSIWRDAPVKIKHKFYHIKKIGGKGTFSFARDYGDIPVARYNYQTGFWEQVVNHRGYAYAARKRMMYRNKHYAGRDQLAAG